MGVPFYGYDTVVVGLDKLSYSLPEFGYPYVTGTVYMKVDVKHPPIFITFHGKKSILKIRRK